MIPDAAPGRVLDEEQAGWRRLWRWDAAAGAVELGAVVGLSAWVLGTGPSLLPWAAAFYVVLSAVWAWVADRLTAPLRDGARDLTLIYGTAVRLGLYSLWLRVALVTGASALLGMVGVVRLGVPPLGVPLLVWSTALLITHLDAGRALLYERQARRTLLGRSPDLALRYLADTLQSRLMLSTLAYGGLGLLLVTLGAMAAMPELRGDARRLHVEDGGALWLPPLLMGLLLLRGLWLRRQARPIERCCVELIVAAARPHAARDPRASDALFAVATRSVAWLPYWLGAAKLWLGLTAVLLVAWVLGGTGSLQAARLALLLGQTLLLWGGVALLEIPAHQATLAPLWPHLAVRAAWTAASPGARRPAPPVSLPPLRWLLVGAMCVLGVTLFVMLALWGAPSPPSSGRRYWLLGGGAIVAGLLSWTIVPGLLSRTLRALDRRVAGLAEDVAASAQTEPLPWLPKLLGGEQAQRLGHALDAVRQAVRERLRGSIHAQAMLEAEAAARTAELLRRNDELRAALADLERTQAELVQAEQVASIGRLVAGIAHEINNPINAVINTAQPLRGVVSELCGAVQARIQALGNGTQPPPLDRALLGEIADMLPVLKRGARRTQEIVQALHSYSHGATEAPSPVDLNGFLDESIELVQHPFKARVRIERDYAELPRVRSIGGQLQQVFVNLLGNAVQALADKPWPTAEPGGTAGSEPLVRIVTQRADRFVTVTVADNGPGIPAEVLPRIFDPFFTTKDLTQGSGLGLSIAHSIAQRHGGSITVETTLGVGTRFVVTLPAAEP